MKGKYVCKECLKGKCGHFFVVALLTFLES